MGRWYSLPRSNFHLLIIAAWPAPGLGHSEMHVPGQRPIDAFVDKTTWNKKNVVLISGVY